MTTQENVIYVWGFRILFLSFIILMASYFDIKIRIKIPSFSLTAVFFHMLLTVFLQDQWIL